MYSAKFAPLPSLFDLNFMPSRACLGSKKLNILNYRIIICLFSKMRSFVDIDSAIANLAAGDKYGSPQTIYTIKHGNSRKIFFAKLCHWHWLATVVSILSNMLDATVIIKHNFYNPWVFWGEFSYNLKMTVEFQISGMQHASFLMRDCFFRFYV